ncbi:hypothetical protein SK128_012094 [Halocaridina rubra]|uniref:Uncharacterized protein n=1 Tax=Halocaridina rubra TaxID=373956 RepID=A0AAN8X6E6_HALRR
MVVQQRLSITQPFDARLKFRFQVGGKERSRGGGAPGVRGRWLAATNMGRNSCGLRKTHAHSHRKGEMREIHVRSPLDGGDFLTSQLACNLRSIEGQIRESGREKTENARQEQ